MSHRTILSGALVALFCCTPLCSTRAPAEETQVSASVAPSTACGKRAGDQIWVISTRQLGSGSVTEALPNYEAQYFAQAAWHDSDTSSFLNQDNPAQPTIFYIHGNRFSTSEAIASGWRAYHALTRCLPAEQHVRFVVWSWPSDKVGGPLRDVRVKSCRTYIESYYLARLITRIEPTVPTGLVGYSFGSRVAVGAVHMAAGGQLEGRVVPDLPKDQATYRVAMFAAGIEDDGLMPGADFQMAMSRTDLLLNYYNHCDPALKRYRFIDKCTRPTAMGYTGVVGENSLGEAAQRIRERNVAGIIGKTHDSHGYFASESIMGEIRSAMIGGATVNAAKVAKRE